MASGKTGSCAGVGWFASSLGYPRSEMVVVTFVRGGNGAAASIVAGEFYRQLLGVATPTSQTVAAAMPDWLKPWARLLPQQGTTAAARKE